MSGKGVSEIHDANMRTALAKHFQRTGYSPIVEEMPFDRLLQAEDDGISGGESEAGEYEMLQRHVGIKGLFRYILAEGHHPQKIMKRLYAAGSGFLIEPFCTMTQEERGLMLGETKAAVSHRMKSISGMIEREGMKGSRLPGQKSKASTANYSASQVGNTNRKKKRRKPVK